MSAVRVRYQTLEFGDVDIHVRSLRDTNEFGDKEGESVELGIGSANWAIFGVLWDAGQVLAHLLHSYDIKGRRVLEVGCGLGLSSLVLNHRHVDVTATDYHPAAGDFLAANVALNGGSEIPFVCTAWDDEDCGMGQFDLIIGSDVLYERAHVAALSAFIDRHAHPTCEVIIVDGGREERGRFTSSMHALGYESCRYKPLPSDYLAAPFGGEILHFARCAD